MQPCYTEYVEGTLRDSSIGCKSHRVQSISVPSTSTADGHAVAFAFIAENGIAPMNVVEGIHWGMDITE
jgi:hypothetical protein